MTKAVHENEQVKSESSLVNKLSERFLVFSMGTESYALPLTKVREVVALGPVTQIPNSPAYFTGVMNLRGQVISVIDLRIKFKITPGNVASEAAIIILDLGSLCIGIIIDSVDAVLSIPAQNISPNPSLENSMHSDSIVGVARVDKKLILILDIEHSLSLEDINAVKNADRKRDAA